MKKSKPRKNTQLTLCSDPVRDTDFTALRQQIRNRVGQEALGMVEATIDAVNNGQYAALKYLFEAVGLFPADVQNETQPPGGLASILLHALGLPEVPVLDKTVTKNSAQS